MSSPAITLASAWLASVALLLYGAEDVRGWVVESRRLSRQSWALRASDELVALADHAQIPSAKRQLEAWLRPPTERYVVLQRPLRDEPAAALPTATSGRAGPSEGATSEATPSAPETLRSVLFIGASSMQYQPGIELERLFGSFYDGLRVTRVGKLSTGLARPDVFDWPKRARELVEQYVPDLVVANFGGNDAQGMVVGKHVLKYGTTAWDDEYARRVVALIEASSARGAKVAILGMPDVRSARSTERIHHVNAVTKRAVEDAGATFISTWEISADEHGAYRKAVEVDGVRGPMRLPDGWHFTRLGGKYVASKLAERIEQRFPLMPADPALAAAHPRTLSSSALKRDASYIAYVPRAPSGQKTCFPVLFLLHGATGSYLDWPTHAHRTLQGLSQRYGIVIVTPDGGAEGWYLDSPLIDDSQYATHLMSEVLPDVTAHFPVTEERAIAGLSAGGHGAITLALEHAGAFVSASSMSGVLDLTAASTREALVDRLGPYRERKDRWEQHSALHLVEEAPDVARKISLLVTVGSSDRWAGTNRRFHEELTSLEIPHVFEERDGGHDWTYWTEELPRHVAFHAERLAEAAARAPKTGRACAASILNGG